jgi:hypothetical protein
MRFTINENQIGANLNDDSTYTIYEKRQFLNKVIHFYNFLQQLPEEMIFFSCTV